MTSNTIDIPALASRIAHVADRSCGDERLTEILQAGKAVDATVRRGDLQAVFGASVSASIHLINSKDDTDDDGVVGDVPADALPADTIDWQPQVPFADGHAWLKYALVANATSAASAPIGMAGAKLSGDRELRMLCYRRHAPTDPLGEAVVADLATLASAMTPGDFAALGVGDAVALRVRGTLAASLTLKWADIFSSSLKGIAEALGAAGDTFRLKISAAASATFSLTIEDDFVLCIAREAETGQAFRVALRKAVSRDARFTAAAGVVVGLDEASVDAVMANVLAGLLEIEQAALDAIDQAPTLSALPQQYRGVVQALAERYGIDAADPLGPLKEKIAAISDDVAGRILAIAKTKVEIGVQYEYLRMGGNAALLEATMSADALDALHANLLAFDFTTLLAGQPGVEVRHFLHEKTTERVQSWGFSLGIGNWLRMLGKQKRTDRFVERRYVAGEVERFTRAYLGNTIYEARVRAWSSVYGAEIKAELAEAKRAGETTGADLQYGLHLWWEERDLAPADDIDRMVDDAVLWGVIREQARPELQRELATALAGIDTCAVRFDAMLADQAFRSAVSALRDTEPTAWGRHSARALPWRNAPTRLSCQAREETYGPFFVAYAHPRTQGTQGSALQTLIKIHLKGTTLDRFESGGHPQSLFKVLVSSGLDGGAFWERWRELRKGADGVMGVVDGQRAWRLVERSFDDMQRSFEQTWLIRAVASRLAEHAHAVASAGLAQGASMTIGFGDQRVVVGGRS